MSERVPAQNKTSAMPPQATQASSSLLHQDPFTSGLSESLGDNSNISKEVGGIQPKTIRRTLNWQNISVEAPSRGNGMSLSGGIQRQQEEPAAVIGGVSADSVQKSPLESSNSTISTERPAQKPLIARAPFNGRNIPVEAPSRSSASNTYLGGVQRLETTGVKEQEESTESLQMQPEGAIQVKNSSGEPQEKEEQNQELVQTKLTVGAPGDKYEQEADSMAAKVMRMPDEAIKPPIQRQTGEQTKAVQMQPLVNSITPLVQRSSGEEEEVQMKSGVQQASDGSSVASGNVENQLAGSKGGGTPLPDDVRSFMEPRFGADFSSVRVHTDSNAVQMNKELGSQAFAHGSDIYYGAGKSPGKNELTAHELTHTIQQTGAAQLNKSVLPKPEPEQEQKQPLQAKKLSSSTPEVIQNKLGTGIAARIQLAKHNRANARVVGNKKVARRDVKSLGKVFNRPQQKRIINDQGDFKKLFLYLLKMRGLIGLRKLATKTDEEILATFKLAKVVKSNPTLSQLLRRRPTLFEQLAKNPKAVQELNKFLEALSKEGAKNLANLESQPPKGTPLTPDQRDISEEIRKEIAITTPPKKPPTQPGYDPTLIMDKLSRDKYLDVLYTQAKEADKELRSVTELLAKITEGEPGFRKGLKGRKRALDKVQEYEKDGANASRLVDIAGSKIVFNSLEELYAGLAQIRDDLKRLPPIKLLQIKDRFIKPQDSGYRDILMNLRMANEHIVEFRLHLKQIDEVAAIEHDLYDVIRTMDTLAKQANKALTTEERALKNAIKRQTQKMYDDALKRALGENSR